MIAALAPIASAAVASDHRDLGAQPGAADDGARSSNRPPRAWTRSARPLSLEPGPRGRVGAADAVVDDLDEQPLKPRRGQTTETAASQACDAARPPSDRDSSNVPAALLGIWPARKPGRRRARPGQSSFAARFGDRRGSRCDAGSVHTTQQDACIREAARARAALIGALAMDDEHERRVRLLLLSEGAVLAHWFQRPVAAGMDDQGQRPPRAKRA
jgi:hypothetical protein